MVASAKIEARNGANIIGWTEFLACKDGLHAEKRVNRIRLKARAVHIHEIGDCSDDRVRSAGEHFSPDENHKASADSLTGSLGDLGNLEKREEFCIGATTIVPGASLDTDALNSFLGKSVVVYFAPNDGHPPTSSRIGCGVIKKGGVSPELAKQLYPLGRPEEQKKAEEGGAGWSTPEPVKPPPNPDETPTPGPDGLPVPTE